MERLNNNDLRLPIRTNANGLSVGDAQEIRNLNESLDDETIRGILETISENRFNSDILRNLMSSISDDTLNRVRDILSLPTYTLQDLTPVLNIIIYANVGFYDFNASTVNLSNLLSDLNPQINFYQSNVEEVGNVIDDITDEANSNSESRSGEYNRERANILSSMNWQSILRRGGTLLFMGAATYLGAPYMGQLGNLGLRILENSSDLSSTVSTGTDLAPRNSNTRIIWHDVSGSFWGSWALLARYMGRRD
jgi:hypothetical protein